MKKIIKAALAFTAFSIITFIIAIVIFGDVGMTEFCVVILAYLMLSFYSSLLIFWKAKKNIYKFIPFIYVIIGVIVTFAYNDVKYSFHPNLTLLLLGIPTLLCLAYIGLAYKIVCSGKKEEE